MKFFKVKLIELLLLFAVLILGITNLLLDFVINECSNCSSLKPLKFFVILICSLFLNYGAYIFYKKQILKVDIKTVGFYLISVLFLVIYLQLLYQLLS